MYIVVQSKDKAPPGNQVGPNYSSVIFFTLYKSYTCPLIQTFCASPNGVHLRELTVVCQFVQHHT